MPADLTWIPCSLQPPPACRKSYYDDLWGHKTVVVITWLASKLVIKKCRACGVLILWCYQHPAEPVPLAWAELGNRGPKANLVCSGCDRRRWNCVCTRPQSGQESAQICGGSF